MDEKPIIPIYTYTRMYMLHTDVIGWNSNLLDTYLDIELKNYIHSLQISINQ